MQKTAKKNDPKISREDLLRVLASVQPGLSPKETVEQSNCFVFTNGEVVTYNDEVCCRAASPLGDFTGAVKAGKLLEMLEKIPEDKIWVDAKGDKLVIRWTGERSWLRVEQEILLSMPMEKPKKWTKLDPEFSEAVSVVKECASQDQSSFEMTCIHIVPGWIEACDNFQLCRWKMETGFEGSTLVRQNALQHIVTSGADEFAVTSSWVHFRNKEDGVYFSCRYYEEEYKDFSKLLNVKGGTLTRLPKKLAEVAERSAIFSAENDKNDRVTVTLKDGRVFVESEGTSGGHMGAKKVSYDGETMVFLISPALLAQLVRKHEECHISPGRLNVKGEKFSYVACLIDPEDVAISEDKAPSKNGRPAKGEKADSPIKNMKRKKNPKREEEEGEEE